VNPAEHIVRSLDRNLSGPAEVRLMGGAALILGYGMPRATEDADLLMETGELVLIVEKAGFSEALEATNRALEPDGLYVAHIWGPEQQILTPSWRERCRVVHLDPPLERLRLAVLGPVDLIVSKLCRADDGDLEDIRWLIEHEALSPISVRAAMQEALVPEAFRDVYPASVALVERLLG
jgi:hypothetical protein